MKPFEYKKTEIDAYAKINLSIDIIDVRPDGYHQVEMIMQTIPLCDRITVVSTVRKGGSAGNPVQCTVRTDNRNLPNDKRDTAWKAAQLMLEAYPQISRQTGEIEISIQKRIPVGGGLGGSSADAAGIIRGFNAHFDLGIPESELMRLGGTLGSDVPFQIKGGTGFVTGTGTEITAISPLSKGTLLICDPGFSLVTKEVYQQYDRMTVPAAARPDTQTLCRLLREGNETEFCSQLRNVLEISAFALKPELVSLKEAIKATGAKASLMSGSGACLYGIYERESLARKAAWTLETQQGCRTFICDISRLR